MRRCWWSFALACGACTSPDRVALIADLPPEVEFVALLLEDANGEVVSSTGLTRWRSDRSLAGEKTLTGGDVARVRVFGYSAAALASLAPLPTDEILAAELVRRAGPTNPLMPPATWAGSAQVSERPVEVLADGTAVALTAAWLPRCPTLIEPDRQVFVDRDCNVIHCPSTILQRDCALTLDFGVCGGRELPLDAAVLDGRGDFEPAQGCTRSREIPEAALSVQCEGCRADVYVAPFERKYEVTTLDVLPGAEVIDLGELYSPHSGYLTGLVPLGYRVVVAVHPERSFPGCPMNAPASQLRVYDGETLAMNQQLEAPPCLRRMAPDPAPVATCGFLAAFAGTPPSLARFDCDAQLVQQERISVAEFAGTEQDPVVLFSNSAGRIIVLFFNPARVGTVVVIDPATLGVVGTVSFPEEIYAAAPADSGRIVVTVGGGGIEIVDPSNGEKMEIEIPSLPLATDGHAIELVPSTGLILVAAAGKEGCDSACKNGAIHALSEVTGWIDASGFYERPASPTALVNWPGGAGLVLVGLASEESPFLGTGPVRPDSWAALFDVERRRFLPGAEAIGFGPVSELRVDGSRVWGVLPWSARLVRFDPL